MRTLEDLCISQPPWERYEGTDYVSRRKCQKVVNGRSSVIATVFARKHEREANARLIVAAPDLLAFAAAYYDRHKKNAINVNPSNGDKYQDGLMMMCKQALVKAGLMDEREMWEENPS